MKRTIQQVISALTAASLLATSAAALAQNTTTNSSSTAPASPAPNRFYGPISKVDTNKMSFTVGDQTFLIGSETQITKDSKPATLADAVVGEPARGTYTKKADGSLTVTKVRFGKKAGGKAGGKKGGKKKQDSTNPSESQ